MDGSTTQDRKTLYEPLAQQRLGCVACTRRCIMNPGESGICKVRANTDGTLVLSNYGRVVTAHVDTIEKKPIYHYRPGSKILSFGTVGCNWNCDFCINSAISQTSEITGRALSPDDLVRLAERHRCQGIAYSYNEPLVFVESVRDTRISHRSAAHEYTTGMPAPFLCRRDRQQESSIDYTVLELFERNSAQWALGISTEGSKRMLKEVLERSHVTILLTSKSLFGDKEALPHWIVLTGYRKGGWHLNNPLARSGSSVLSREKLVET